MPTKFHYAYIQGEFEMAATVDISEAANSSEYEVKVESVRLDEEEKTWGALAMIWGTAPQFVEAKRSKLELKRDVESSSRKNTSSCCDFLLCVSRARAILIVFIVLLRGCVWRVSLAKIISNTSCVSLLVFPV